MPPLWWIGVFTLFLYYRFAPRRTINHHIHSIFWWFGVIISLVCNISPRFKIWFVFLFHEYTWLCWIICNACQMGRGWLLPAMQVRFEWVRAQRILNVQTEGSVVFQHFLGSLAVFSALAPADLIRFQEQQCLPLPQSASTFLTW